MRVARVVLLVAFPFWLALSHGAAAAPAAPFYRIVVGPRPDRAQVQRDQILHGATTLYTDEVTGNGPVKVKGTVWHANLAEARYFIGTRNPSIANRRLLQKIENDKWQETLLLQRYVPDLIPRTENLAELLPTLGLPPHGTQAAPDPAARLDAIAAALRLRYPNGFFIKHVSGFNSDGTFPTEKTEFSKTLRQFETAVEPKIAGLAAQKLDDTEIHLQLKQEPGYEGRILKALLQTPDKVIIQEKVDAAFVHYQGTPVIDEYRVHAVGGRVLRGGSFQRWLDAYGRFPATLAEVESVAQALLDRLPPKVRRMSFAMDLMRTKDGGYRLIELNAGGESGFLYPESDTWVPQLLAERFTGKRTPLQRRFDRFTAAQGLAAKRTALGKLLGSRALRPLAKDDANGELGALVKDHLIGWLQTADGAAHASEVADLLTLHDLNKYLTDSDRARLGP